MRWAALILAGIVLSAGLEAMGQPFWLRMVACFLLGLAWPTRS
jgi:hypothetical protein